ncbi:MAG: ABC transporter permease [Bryobacteraceae bacterium]
MRWWWKKEREQDLEREMRADLDLEAAEQEQNGLSPEQARYAARRAFGNTTLVKEELREMWGWSWFERFGQDLRYGLRSLVKGRGLTLIGVLTLALGIGANTAIFSVVNSLLIRPLPYKNSGELVVPATVLKKYNTDRANVAYADFLDWKTRTEVFQAVAVHFEQSADITSGHVPERVKTSLVSDDYFRVMDAAPLLGRTFVAEETFFNQAHVAVLAYAYWMQRFGGDPKVVGARIEIGGAPYRIVGVMAMNSTWPEDVQVFLPGAMGADPPAAVMRRDNFMFSAIARLRPGVRLEQAQAQLNVMAKRIERQYPATRSATGWVLYPLSSWIVGPQLKQMLLVMMGGVGIVLAIACANLATLLLARGASRTREIAIRIALGARRVRLARQLLTEQLVVAAIGAVLGALLGTGGVYALVHVAPRDTPRLDEIHIDGVALAFTSALSILATFIAAVIPALHASGTDPANAFREGGRTSSAGMRAGRLRGLLVLSEVALSVVLLAGAGLLLKTFANLLHVDAGFRTQGLTTFELSLPTSRYGSSEQTVSALTSIVDKIRHVPGVLNVGATSALPLGGGGFYLVRSYIAGGQPEPPLGKASSAVWDVVMPGYFETLRARLIAGRFFDNRDIKSGKPVMIVSQSLAKEMFPNANPLGKSVRAWRDEKMYREVVGIIGDMPYFSLADDRSPAVYVPITQQECVNTMLIAVRAPENRHALIPALRTAVWSFDKQLAVAEIKTMDDVMSKALARPRFVMFLLSLFAGAALLLAGAGIYGVLSYAVAQRTQEIGIRVALGAKRIDVLRMIASRGMALTFCGIAIGVVLAGALTRIMASLLFGVTARDPAIFTLASLFLLIVAVMAYLIPAWRANQIDPVAALRCE